MSSIEIISDKLIVRGGSSFGEHCFTSGNTVPVFNIETFHALNQAIGFVKYKNRNNGDVFYRGQCKLYNSMLPSIFHKRKTLGSRHKAQESLNKVISNISTDVSLSKSMGFKAGDDFTVIEGMLQHYGYPTRCIDVVDNHWVALWFGLYEHICLSESDQYFTLKRRDFIPKWSLNTADERGYQYLIMLCANKSVDSTSGVIRGEDVITVDLRVALPSMFIRPHAQHGVVLKKVGQCGDEDFDLSSRVVAIFRLRIEDVSQWLGNGQLLTQDSLFPSKAFDFGYNILLKRQQDLNLHLIQYL